MKFLLELCEIYRSIWGKLYKSGIIHDAFPIMPIPVNH